VGYLLRKDIDLLLSVLIRGDIIEVGVVIKEVNDHIEDGK
jgi:hypothetical protein